MILGNIYLYLTQGCNQACRHCWLSPKFDEDGSKYPVLTFDHIKVAIEEGKGLGLKSVKLTGGEPLLHPEFINIVKYLRENGLNVLLETNGLLLDNEDMIEAIQHVDSSISLDGVNAETHDWMRGVSGSFDKLMENFEKLKFYGAFVQLIMTVMKRNVDQVEEMILNASNWGMVSSIKFNVLHPMGRGKNVHLQDLTLDVREILELGRRVEENLSNKYNMSLIFDYPLSFSIPRIVKARRNCVCDILHIIGLIPGGYYALCGVGEFIPELVFGKIEDGLKNVWENNQVLKDLRAGLPKKLEGICSRCKLSNLCLGSCVAQNYFNAKNLWAPFYLCEELYESGEFPAYFLKVDKVLS